MATRLVVQGHVFWANAEARQALRQAERARGTLPRGRDGGPLQGAESPAVGIPGEAPTSPFRAGVAWLDTAERLTYRVVGQLNPVENWATTEWWQGRWGVSHFGVLQLAREGLLDAAIEQKSQVRRFRCRNEVAVLKHDVVLRATIERRRRAQEGAQELRRVPKIRSKKPS